MRVSVLSIVSTACRGLFILFFRMKIILQTGGEEGCKTTVGPILDPFLNLEVWDSKP